MLLKEKINLKKYLLFTLLSCLVISTISWRNEATLLLYAGFVLSVILNQYFLFKGVSLVIYQHALKVNFLKTKIILYFIGKLLFLFGSFYVASRLIPSDVIYAVILYIFQLIIFVISIKKSLKQK